MLLTGCQFWRKLSSSWVWVGEFFLSRTSNVNLVVGWLQSQEECMVQCGKIPFSDPLPGDMVREAQNHTVRNQRTTANANKGDMLPETRLALDTFYAKYNRLLADLLADERFTWQ